jgi:pSer/pThr/pTyr-binding forkhead associated (FHA) protein/tetratricopeptide (TPR) repeat protein
MFKLLIEDDEGKTVAVPLIRDEITIGRKEGNTIRLSDQNVSRKHARLLRQDGVLNLEDLSSYNGTKLNGTPVSKLSPLKDGDLIIIGDYRMRINEDRSAKAAPPVAASVAPAPVEPAIAAAPPPVQDPMEGHPTIPVRSMPDLNLPGESASARLVVISRHMAGAEFVLDRASLVIGRTPENDIILDHKSISRHHAKLIREGSQYVLVDLESANGVRVNGVEQDRAILEAGDTVELGQMRLRFVCGDGVVDDEAPAGMGGKRLIIGLGGTAVLAAVVVYLVVSGGSKPPAPVASNEPVPAAPSAPAQPAPQPAATASPAAPGIPAAGPSFDELMAEARASQTAERWDDALAAAKKAVAVNPESGEAARLRQVAESEKENAGRLAGLREPAEAGNLEAVTRTVAEIPDDSVYKERARTLEKTTRAQFLAQHLEAATSAVAAKDCEQAGPHIEQVLAVEPGNTKASGLSTKCQALAKAQAKTAAKAEAIAARSRPAPAAKPTAPKPALAAAPKPAKPEPAESAESAPDPDQLIQQARESWLRGQYASAVESARKALRIKPGLTSAYQIIAICSCSLKDADAAARAYERLDDRNKQMVRSVCQKNGISL